MTHKQRRRRHVGGNVSRHRDQEPGRHRREERPAAERAPARRRRCRLCGAPRDIAARGRAQQQHAARGDQHEQQPVAAAPHEIMLPQRKIRLEQERIGEEREKAADIGGGVEEIRVLAVGVSGAHEPGLQQRRVGGECEERQPDRDDEQADQPQRRPMARRIAPAVDDRQGQRQSGDDEQRGMDRHR